MSALWYKIFIYPCTCSSMYPVISRLVLGLVRSQLAITSLASVACANRFCQWQLILSRLISFLFLLHTIYWIDTTVYWISYDITFFCYVVMNSKERCCNLSCLLATRSHNAFHNAFRIALSLCRGSVVTAASFVPHSKHVFSTPFKSLTSLLPTWLMSSSFFQFDKNTESVTIKLKTILNGVLTTMPEKSINSLLINDHFCSNELSGHGGNNCNDEAFVVEGDEDVLTLNNSRLHFIDNGDNGSIYSRLSQRNGVISYISGNANPNHLMPCSQMISPLELESSLIWSQDNNRNITVNSIDFSNHCHPANFHQLSSASQQAKKQLVICTLLCLTFMIAELCGGLFANSLAIMTDAAHLLSDLASFLLSLAAIWISQRRPTRSMSFGFYRAEVLGAIAGIFLIWILTGVLVYLAVERVRHQDYEIDAPIMLITSGFGVLMNIVMGNFYTFLSIC